MREITLDTETTGFNKKKGCRVEKGHRIIEIACVEIINGIITGNFFHRYVNPQRKIDSKAIRIHGITDKKVKGMPLFRDIVIDLLEFLGDSNIIIHNASFDVAFLDQEFKLLPGNVQPQGMTFHVTDSLEMARERFPGENNSLNGLAERLHIGITRDGFHNALIDAQMLARIYLSM